MSLTKRWIEEEKMKGNDVLHSDYQSNYDEYEYEQYCYYSGLPSLNAYNEYEEFDNRD